MKKRTLNGRKSRNNLMIFAADKLTLTSAGRKAVFCSFASFSNSGLRYGLGNVEIQINEFLDVCKCIQQWH